MLRAWLVNPFGICAQSPLSRSIHTRPKASQAVTIPASEKLVSSTKSDHESLRNFKLKCGGGRLGKHSYEKAIAHQGYQGTFDQWRLENPLTARKTGVLPYISSLRHVAHPAESDLIRWLPRRGKKYGRYEAQRHVLVDGKDQGSAALTFTAPKGGEKLDEFWLRPYFDPASQSLKFQSRDGIDFPYMKPLPILARSSTLRPLLHLAHHEGLLNSIPPSGLPSLHFERVRDSGFAIYSRLYNSGPYRHRVCKTKLRVLHDGGSHSERLVFTPILLPDQEDLCHFPYIGSGGLLHLWDVGNDYQVKLHNLRGVVKEGWSVHEVHKRWPKLFQLAQSEGFWADHHAT